GLVSLVTPCVFPMIPVTVSFFLKQSEKKKAAGDGSGVVVKGPPVLLMAAIYCGTIVGVLWVGGMILGHFLQAVSQHYLTNFFLTGVFLVFALSLLGMYDIQLPSSLANMSAAQEGRGGLVGIMFMALTFSIISFACVGPIYGGFITLEATRSSEASAWLRWVLGPLAFALTFAAPFFILALFPSLLKSLPRSG